MLTILYTAMGETLMQTHNDEFKYTIVQNYFKLTEQVNLN